MAVRGEAFSRDERHAIRRHRGTGQHDRFTPALCERDTEHWERGGEKTPSPPQQHHLDRCHEAEDDHPFQPGQPPVGRTFGRLRQQSGRVAQDRHDHDRNHVPQVKGHHIAVGYGQHALDGAGAQRTIERRREGYHQSRLRVSERQHRHGGRRRIVNRLAGNADHADRIGSQPDQQCQRQCRPGGEQHGSATG